LFLKTSLLHNSSPTSSPLSSAPSNNQYCLSYSNGSFLTTNNNNFEIKTEPFEINNGTTIEQPALQTISEDEQQQITTPSSNNSDVGGTTRRRREHSSLSQSAREKRIELRECKAKVDSLEKEELEERLRQQQQLQKQKQAEWEVAQQRRLLPHYYQQSLNER
jgi:flagellar motility protein MotE (MotC chaperone)